jgi:hypothetical protein
MTALLVAESTTVDIYAEADRAMLEERWASAGAQLDGARRHVEVGIGQLFRLLPALGDPFDLVQTIVERWITETIFDLRCSAREGDLPGGAR